MTPLYLTCGIPKATWYRWLGKLVLADRDSRGRYRLCPRELRLAQVAGALHKLGIREPQLALLLGRLREMGAPERTALLDNLVIVRTGRRTFGFYDHLGAVPQIRPVAIYHLAEMLGGMR